MRLAPKRDSASTWPEIAGGALRQRRDTRGPGRRAAAQPAQAGGGQDPPGVGREGPMADGLEQVPGGGAAVPVLEVVHARSLVHAGQGAPLQATGLIETGVQVSVIRDERD